jgi:hypothetical protein
MSSRMYDTPQHYVRYDLACRVWKSERKRGSVGLANRSPAWIRTRRYRVSVLTSTQPNACRTFLLGQELADYLAFVFVVDACKELRP